MTSKYHKQGTLAAFCESASFFMLLAMKDEVERLVSLLREEGVSSEMCHMIKRNADAGALEFAREILYGEGKDDVEDVQK